jgi:hypothetical protein
MTQTLTTTCPDLGTFEGFNFRDQCAIERTLTVDEVVNWDHDADGEAEFWPSGEDPLVKGIFDGNVTASDLTALAELLISLDGDRTEDLLRISFAIQVQGCDLAGLTARELEDNPPMFFYGDTMSEARKEAAFELFETYWPDLFKAWNEDHAGILDFDWYAFVDSPLWTIHEVKLGNKAILMVASN